MQPALTAKAGPLRVDTQLDKLVEDAGAVCRRRDVGQDVHTATDRLDQQTPHPRQRLHLRLERQALDGRHVNEDARNAVGEGAEVEVVADEAARVVRHVYARLPGDGREVDARLSC